MKLLLAIIRDSDTNPISKKLIEEGFRVTCISTTGGFLRRGSSTLMIGVEDDKVDDAIDIIKESADPPVDPGTKRATIFILNVDEFYQL